jgi:serine/threonine protein kinase
MYRAPELMSQHIDYLESQERKSASELPSFYGLAIDMWSVGMVFSELLLCACGKQGQHLFQGVKFRPSTRSSPRHKLADEERQRMNYILEQIGLEKLTKSHACIASPPPDDLATAIDLLSQLLQKDWQGDSARICAGKALEHEFFSRDSSEQFSAAAARERIAGEKKRFKDVGSSLRQIEHVRWTPPPPLFSCLICSRIAPPQTAARSSSCGSKSTRCAAASLAARTQALQLLNDV